MSTLWLEPFIFDPTDSNIFTFQSVNIVIYLNMISVICFVVYCMIYKMDLNMQKPPNTLIIWKMFGECLISVHLLILFLCFEIENNKRKLELTKYIMWIISLISPIGLFITYYFTGCIAQNLYCTFYNYKNNFDYRMQKYKIYAVFIGVFVFISAILFNSKEGSTTSVKFSLKYYPIGYIGFIYFSGALVMLFILIKTLFVIKKKTSFFSFMNQTTTNDTDNLRHTVVSLFVSRHLMFCYVFLICFLPNNIVLLMQIFVSVKVCEDCRVYSFVIYLISLSGSFSFVIKMTEPYMKKYIQVVFAFIMRRNAPEQLTEDYSTIYKGEINPRLLDNSEINEYSINDDNNNNNLDIRNTNKNDRLTFKVKEMDYLNSEEAKLNSMADTVEIVTREMQTNDFYKSLISIYLAVKEDSILEHNDFLLKNKNGYLPWEDAIYDEKSKLLHYTSKNAIQLFGTNDDFSDSQFFNVKIRKYAPRIFYHLREIDDISNEDFLKSLNPKDNLKIIKESFASGGRSSNPIIFTYDKKLLLKTISSKEKKILIEILPEFHRKMRDCKSLLCRIYGMFRIEVLGKQGIHIIVMRNMNELPSESKVACFDLKGSTVERTSLSKGNKEQVLKGYKDDVLEMYRKIVLKDLDFNVLGFNFNFSKEICDMLQNSICEDSEFLKGNNLIDYSMLCSIHKYNKENEDNVSKNQRYRIIRTQDGKYLYNLSIIDFLTPYGLSKKFEFGFKFANAMVRENKDTNFSVLDATRYSRRFIRYLNQQFKPSETLKIK